MVPFEGSTLQYENSICPASNKIGETILDKTLDECVEECRLKRDSDACFFVSHGK
jgi:hypothetical protein